LLAQNDWKRWGSVEISYQIKKPADDTASSAGSIAVKAASVLRSLYKYFISDLDGDNCPFYPSCSAFFVDAVKETNLIMAMLSFSDRFTRDLNFFKGLNDYPLHNSGKYYDPAVNYTLNSRLIKYYSGGSIVE
jgi:putative component of membrane protein insertase Oxa1/YidC/SpoIIIJ protein YidD